MGIWDRIGRRDSKHFVHPSLSRDGMVPGGTKFWEGRNSFGGVWSPSLGTKEIVREGS